MKLTCALLAALVLPVPALADLADSKSCADDLSPSARTVYSESIRSMRTGQDPQEAVTIEVRRLVADGTLRREWARDVTAAAVQCIKKLRS